MEVLSFHPTFMDNIEACDSEHILNIYIIPKYLNLHSLTML